MSKLNVFNLPKTLTRIHLPLLLCALVISPSIVHSSASSGSTQSRHLSLPYDPAGLQRAAELQLFVEQAPINDVLQKYSTKLPSSNEASFTVDDIIRRHTWGEKFNRSVQKLKFPKMYERITTSPRMLFTGPSGCGKTFAAKALAIETGMECIFIRSLSIKLGGPSSAPNFLTTLLHRLADQPDRRFLVILDDISPLSEARNVLYLWRQLTNFTNLKNVCLVGTDQNDPNDYERSLRQYFTFNIYKFEHVQLPGILTIMKQRMKSENAFKEIQAEASSSTVTNERIPKLYHVCSEEFLIKKAKEASHFSIRVIVEFMEQAKAIAAEENLDLWIAEQDPISKQALKDRPIVVEERHLNKVWQCHVRGTKPNYYIENLTSPTAVSTYGILAIATLIGFNLLKKS